MELSQDCPMMPETVVYGPDAQDLAAAEHRLFLFGNPMTVAGMLEPSVVLVCRKGCLRGF